MRCGPERSRSRDAGAGQGSGSLLLRAFDRLLFQALGSRAMYLIDAYYRAGAVREYACLPLHLRHVAASLRSWAAPRGLRSNVQNGTATNLFVTGPAQE